MLTEQDICAYKNLVMKLSNIELSLDEARAQAEKIFRAYLTVYSKDLTACAINITQ